MMNLLLIRHASNDWLGKRLAGWTPGVHLNDKGRAEAEALAKGLAAIPLDAIYSSPLERTLETAKPVAAAQRLSIEIREALGESHIGDWAGQTLEELQKDDLWPVVQAYPGGFRFPGGESMQETQARFVAEIDAIRDAHPKQTVAVVSHSDPIKLAVAYYTGLPLDLFQRLVISPASVTALSFSRFGPRLICMNYVDSLPSFKIEEKVAGSVEPDEEDEER
jgi:probable phosphoglycerate mutase